MGEVLHKDFSKSAQLTTLEASVLTEYQILAKNLNSLNEQISNLNEKPSAELLENLRVLETKMALVFTLFKGAVYSLFLPQSLAANQEDILEENTNNSF